MKNATLCLVLTGWLFKFCDCGSASKICFYCVMSNLMWKQFSFYYSDPERLFTLNAFQGKTEEQEKRIEMLMMGDIPDRNGTLFDMWVYCITFYSSILSAKMALKFRRFYWDSSLRSLTHGREYTLEIYWVIVFSQLSDARSWIYLRDIESIYFVDPQGDFFSQLCDTQVWIYVGDPLGDCLPIHCSLQGV